MITKYKYSRKYLVEKYEIPSSSYSIDELLEDLLKIAENKPVYEIPGMKESVGQLDNLIKKTFPKKEETIMERIYY